MAAKVVDAVVERAHRLLDPQAHEQRPRTPKQRPGAAGEEQEGEKERPEDEQPLEPQVRADVVVADREHEPDRAEQHRPSPAERRARGARSRVMSPTRPGWRRDVSKMRIASPPIDVGSTWLAV